MLPTSWMETMTRKNLLPKWQRSDSIQGLPTPAYPKVKDCQQQHPFHALPRTKQRSPQTHFLIEFFLEGKSFFKLPMLHFHFPLIKANLCIF